MSQVLSEEVGRVVATIDEVYFDLLILDVLSNSMVSNVDVL